MSDPNDPLTTPAAPETTGAAPAPGAGEGQAGGSPPPGETPTSGGNGEGEAEKALRRKLTEQAEELKEAKKAAKVLEVAMSKPGWKAVEAEILGKSADAEDLDKDIFGEDPRLLETGKKWKDRLRQEIREEILREMRPVAAEVATTKEERDLGRFLASEGLPKDERFDAFREDFMADNPSYEALRRVNPQAASKWLVSSFSIQQKRAGRQPAGDRADASLERGGGTPARVGSAASQVKIAHNDPQKIHKLHEALTKGETPVDENGNPYRVPRR